MSIISTFEAIYGIVKLTEVQLADLQEIGVERAPESHISRRDSEIACQLDSALKRVMLEK